jgi:hypothetical protein
MNSALQGSHYTGTMWQPPTPWGARLAQQDAESSDALNRRLGIGPYRNAALRNGGRCVECDSSGRHKSTCSRHGGE